MVAAHAFPLALSGMSEPLPPSTAPRVDRALGGPRRLSLLDTTPNPGCMTQARRCGLTSCRHHLGAARTLSDGHTFRCSVDVANAYPLGLAPSDVAVLAGMTESEVQIIEREAYGRMRLGLQRLKNDEFERGLEARERDRLARATAAPRRRIRPATPAPCLLTALDSTVPPARAVAPVVVPPAPAIEAPALVLTLCPPVPLRRRRTATPRPRRAAPPLPGQMAFSWAAAA